MIYLANAYLMLACTAIAYHYRRRLWIAATVYVIGILLAAAVAVAAVTRGQPLPPVVLPLGMEGAI